MHIPTCIQAHSQMVTNIMVVTKSGHHRDLGGPVWDPQGPPGAPKGAKDIDSAIVLLEGRGLCLRRGKEERNNQSGPKGVP
jgi:hypothetical protein